MAQIKITPEELEKGANDVKTQQAQILDILAALNNTITNVANNWEGAAKSSFFESFSQLYRTTLTKDFPSILEGIQKQLNEAARIMRETDEALSNALK